MFWLTPIKWINTTRQRYPEVYAGALKDTEDALWVPEVVAEAYDCNPAHRDIQQSLATNSPVR